MLSDHGTQRFNVTKLEDETAEGERRNLHGPSQAVEGYRIRNALKVPRTTSYTAQALYDQILTGDVQLNSNYQRNVVWPDTKMIGLVDSLYRNIYVPPIVFTVVVDEDGTEKRICTDGKQRLTAIQRFIDGLIPHRDASTHEKLWFTDTGAKSLMSKNILPQKYRNLFANKQIMCVEYHDIDEDDEREIFQRTQLGMALTPPEKLRATNSSRASFIRSLLIQFLSSSASSRAILSIVDWAQSSDADKFHCLTQIVYCLYNYPAWPELSPQSSSISPPLSILRRSAPSASKALSTIGSMLQLEQFVSDQSPFGSAFVARVQEALRVTVAIIRDPDVGNVLRTPALLTSVELVGIVLLLGIHMQEAEYGGISGEGINARTKKPGEERAEKEEKRNVWRKNIANGIKQIRRHVRERHRGTDIRLSDRVGRTVIEAVKTWSPLAEELGTDSNASRDKLVVVGVGDMDSPKIDTGEATSGKALQPTNQTVASPTSINNSSSRPTPLPTTGSTVTVVTAVAGDVHHKLAPTLQPTLPKPDRLKVLREAKAAVRKREIQDDEVSNPRKKRRIDEAPVDVKTTDTATRRRSDIEHQDLGMDVDEKPILKQHSPRPASVSPSLEGTSNLPRSSIATITVMLSDSDSSDNEEGEIPEAKKSRWPSPKTEKVVDPKPDLVGQDMDVDVKPTLSECYHSGSPSPSSVPFKAQVTGLKSPRPSVLEKGNYVRPEPAAASIQSQGDDSDGEEGEVTLARKKCWWPSLKTQLAGPPPKSRSTTVTATPISVPVSPPSSALILASPSLNATTSDLITATITPPSSVPKLDASLSSCGPASGDMSNQHPVHTIPSTLEQLNAESPQPRDMDSNDAGIKWEAEFLDNLRVFYGYLPPNPYPTSVPPLNDSDIGTKKVFRAFGESADTILSFCQSMPVTNLLKNYLQELLKETEAPPEICDIHPNSRTPLTVTPRLWSIRRVSHVDDAGDNQLWYMFNFQNDACVPWHIAVESPAHALIICRLDNEWKEPEIVRYLLQHGVPFHTLQLAPKDPVGRASAPLLTSQSFPTLQIPERPNGNIFSHDDYTTYVRRRKDILSQPRGRAALMAGGYLWRLSVSEISHDAVIRGPISWCDGGVADETLFIARDVDSGMVYFDDKLTAAETLLVLGAYLNSEHQVQFRSWYPVITPWEGTGEHYGRWGSYREEQYILRTKEIGNPDNYTATFRGPLPAEKWRNIMRGRTEAKTVNFTLKRWALNFVRLHVRPGVFQVGNGHTVEEPSLLLDVGRSGNKIRKVGLDQDPDIEQVDKGMDVDAQPNSPEQPSPRSFNSTHVVTCNPISTFLSFSKASLSPPQASVPTVPRQVGIRNVEEEDTTSSSATPAPKSHILPHPEPLISSISLPRKLSVSLAQRWERATKLQNVGSQIQCKHSVPLLTPDFLNGFKTEPLPPDDPNFGVACNSWEASVLDILKFHYGYVPPVPYPASVPLLLPPDVEIKKVFKAFGERVEDIAVFYSQAVITMLANAFLQDLIKESDLPALSSDLHPANNTLLKAASRLKHIRSVYSGAKYDERWYMFDYRNDATVPWNLAVRTARHALLVCRLKEEWTESDIVHYLLQHGIPFRTLQPRPIDRVKKGTAPLPSPASCDVTSYACDQTFTREHHEAYAQRRDAFLLQPRGRAAMMAGGFLWRLAVPLVHFDAVLSGPTKGVSTVSGDTVFTARDGYSGLVYFDDKLTEAEENILCGAYVCFTDQKNQLPTKSWYPPSSIFDQSGGNYGRWCSYYEERFIQRTVAINNLAANDLGRPLTFGHWQNWLEGMEVMNHTRDHLERWSLDFLKKECLML